MNHVDAINLYIENAKARHLTPNTLKGLGNYLNSFAHWCELNHLDDLRDATEEHLHKFYTWMKHRKRPDGQPLSVNYINRHLRVVQQLFTLLADQNFIMTDIGKNFPPLHYRKALPRGVMTEKQIMKLLRQPEMSTPLGFRDRAILETLYSTALRSGELCRLTLYDIDFKDRVVRVILGKGRKHRVVPIGKTAASYVTEYIKTVRPVLLGQQASALLFVTATGLNMRTTDLARIVKKYRDQAKLPDNITTHSLRHTCATEMLRGGASIRHVQELLGHADISTTQIYTHVVQSDLKRIHARTAPGEQRKKTEEIHFDPENAVWNDSHHKNLWALVHSGKKRALEAKKRKEKKH